MTDKKTYISINIRGALIERAVLMERGIDLILGNYFAKNHNVMDDLFNLILCTDRISLNSKWQVLKYIIEKRYDSYNRKRDGAMLKRIEKLIQERNVFAHLLIENSDKSPSDNSAISFFKHKNEITILRYSEDEINSLLLDFKEVAVWLNDIYSKKITYPPSE